MEHTGAISPGARQYLDRLQVEKERGITVKAQTASLVYQSPLDNQHYLFNLVDTPGHVDFSYEVSRSLAACQGCVLLVDATQGIQAQTVANFYLAFEQDMTIVPVLNKIDMPAADPPKIAEQLKDAFDIDPSSCLSVSAKTGKGMAELLDAIVERVPPPSGSPSKPPRLLLFDAFHDEYKGVVSLVTVIDGKIRKGDVVTSMYTGDEWEVHEMGVLAPEPHPTGELLTGQVGYLLTGMKDTRAARVGDTWHLAKRPVEQFPGFKEPKSMVFAGIFPINASGFDQLRAAMEKLTLNDASVTVKRENSNALGAGFRCGFLGLLHLDVFRQRLEQEHGAEVIVTAPTVPFRVQLASQRQSNQSSSGSSGSGGSSESYHPFAVATKDAAQPLTMIELQSPSEFPTDTKLSATYEPTVNATIMVPTEMVGAVMKLCQERRGDLLEHSVLSASRAMMRYTLPLAELGGDFYDELKSSSSGYATFDYDMGEYRSADLIRLDVLVNGEPVDALARVVHRSRAEPVGRALCAKLKELMARQQFDIALQTQAGGRIVARETLKAFRKNVTSKCYGGDITRKKKLLEKQKEGKKRMRRLGSVDVPAEALHEIMRAGS